MHQITTFTFYIICQKNFGVYNIYDPGVDRTYTWLLQGLITKHVTVLLSETWPNVLDLCSSKHELEHMSCCLLYLSTWLKLKARAHFCGFSTPKYLSIMMCTLCLHQPNPTPDNDTEIKRRNGRSKVKHGAAACRSFILPAGLPRVWRWSKSKVAPQTRQ